MNCVAVVTLPKNLNILLVIHKSICMCADMHMFSKLDTVLSFGKNYKKISRMDSFWFPKEDGKILLVERKVMKLLHNSGPFRLYH